MTKLENELKSTYLTSVDSAKSLKAEMLSLATEKDELAKQLKEESDMQQQERKLYEKELTKIKADY